MAKTYLAFDLGASSGRAILGRLEEGRLTLEEIHRFDNGGIDVNGRLHWDVLGLFTEMKAGLRKALAAEKDIAAMAVDTWGVDFALLDKAGSFVGYPYHYRDQRTADIFDYVFSRVPRETLYGATGIQFMNFNTIFQLAAMERDHAPALRIAHRLLMMPNALTYLLSGSAVAEYTIATTTQAYNPAERDWAWDVIAALGLPKRLFPKIVPPCTVAGPLRDAVCQELNCKPIPVVLVGSHDTASAVAAVPALAGRTWAYLSSGTWSLLGVELDAPLMTPAAMRANYTNEGGVGGTIRFLKNIMGLWLVQESRATWMRQGQTFSFGELTRLAADAPPFQALIDPNDDRFLAPGDMPARIREFCAASGQTPPTTPAAVVRCALESLALRYRQTIEEVESITGRRIEVLQLVGGGSQNELLNQFAASAIGRPVVTGPVEATAIGNIVCQAMATGDIANLAAARDVVRNSFETREYRPQDTPAWEAAYSRYRSLCR